MDIVCTKKIFDHANYIQAVKLQLKSHDSC